MKRRFSSGINTGFSTKGPLVYDPKLLPRINKFLERDQHQPESESGLGIENTVETSTHPQVKQPSISVDEIVEYLRATYQEYKRKPLNSFTVQVSRVCDQQRENILRNLNANEKASSNEFSDTMPTQSGSSLVSNHGPSTPTASYSTQNNNNDTVDKGNRKKRMRSSSMANSTPISSSNLANSSGNDGWTPKLAISDTRYSDMGGIDSIIEEVMDLIEFPLLHPEVYMHYRKPPPRGILLYGPTGCGKTTFANAIAGELQSRGGVNFIRLSGTEIVSGMSGESEAKIRSLFTYAQSVAPCIVFLYEIDAITPKRSDAQKDLERRIVSQLISAIDSLSKTVDQQPSSMNTDDDDDDDDIEIIDPTNKSQSINCPPHVVIIGATNRPDSLDPALRRAGRFDREIGLPMPDSFARENILKVLARGMPISPSVNFSHIAQSAVGYVGADLDSLCLEAIKSSINRNFRRGIPPTLAPPQLVQIASSTSMDTDLNGLQISTSTTTTQNITTASPLRTLLRTQPFPFTSDQLTWIYIDSCDFQEALKKVQPSSKREGFVTVPDVNWDDIGALDGVRNEIKLTVLDAIRDPKLYAALGLSVPAGVLLYGPPGCGKTLVAKAIASEARASFISVKGPELLSQYVGESERAVRQVFERARACAPSVIFFDEFDSLCPRRSSGGSDGNKVGERVVNQLLTEMDGLSDRRQVFVIAATNRPDMIDNAMLRPGRLGKLLYVPMPHAAERASILGKHIRHVPLASDVDLIRIAQDKHCEGYSGADCAALVREATLFALSEERSKSLDSSDSSASTLAERVQVHHRHFIAAFNQIAPSVSESSRKRYEQLHESLRRGRAAAAGTPKIDDNDIPVSSA